jgi:spore maturation protein CgeB
MKIVLTYNGKTDEIQKRIQSFCFESPADIEVVPISVSIPPKGRIDWHTLHDLWISRHDSLLSLYKKILVESQSADVFFALGPNIHPEFLRYLHTYNVYMFCDDPEDSPWQSAKFAPAFDAACYANIASGFQYESWGCRRHSWLPIFTAPTDVPSQGGESEIFKGGREENIVFGGGLDDYSSYRGRRLRKLSEAFPEALCYGRGWEKGEKTYTELAKIYLKTKIGWNIHRTTGPINRRMFQLPAHGVMQICDNKTGLGQIFELGKEVEGFDTIDEAIELTKYYLDHEQERAAIARAGYKRFWKDYHAGAVWTRLRNKLLEWGVRPGERKRGAKQKLPTRNTAYFIGKIGKSLGKQSDRLIRSAKAAKREYLRQDPWWKIYDRVFTSEAVYLPDYGDAPPLESEPASDVPSPEVTRARQGAIRWAMSQLIGKSKRIGIRDSLPHLLEAYVSVDSKRQVDVLIEEENLAGRSFDLLMSIPICDGANGLLDELKWCAKMAPEAVFAFTDETSLVRKSGEVYWLLKSLYEEVSVFKMPNPVVPWLEPVRDGNVSGPFVAWAKV